MSRAYVSSLVLSEFAAQSTHRPFFMPVTDSIFAAGAAAAADVAIADCFHLPYRRASCDAVLCIAVLHHISSSTRRLRVLTELLATLRPGTASPLVAGSRRDVQLAVELNAWSERLCCCLRVGLAVAMSLLQVARHW